MTEYFVSYYDPESGTIKTGFVDSRLFKNARINMTMSHEVGKDHPIDDEFARRLGGAALLWFATQYPELRDFLEVTDGKGNKVSI
ncbi:hypothetical protein GXB81_26725 [Paraburkholderia sp. Ac-20336]|uniref:hypothetical protein n=1 Tax=Burkholderiaceae TaxID=119060 RepID=UPI001420C65A|nr:MULTISPECIES: hypothetical protein [Burkholderiaceae]MBN3806617.1 hypothetical protein [Paraburkholderia sp. Ac-20336]MBN3849018.1 hypothetical protein [Paraburkholderia sp. Ac-20342]NIF52391.1 hypothetical protein [Burkholderia sp. Ax-1724]NIF80286.1 hypothetical protein [Paraburkholderia sp. Cy-641]